MTSLSLGAESGTSDKAEGDGRSQPRVILRAFVNLARVGLIVLFAYVAASRINTVIQDRLLPSHVSSLQDYGSFMHSAEALRDGLNPYAYYPDLQPQPYNEKSLNLNPPISLIPFSALHKLGDKRTRDTLQWLSLLLVMFAFLAMHSRIGILALLLMLASEPLNETIRLGQIYVVLGLLSVLAWIFIKRGRLTGASVWLGLLVAVKPPLLIIPVLMFVAGHRRIAIGTVVAVGVFSLLPLVLYGSGVYADWFALVRQTGVDHREPWPENTLSLTQAGVALLHSRVSGLALTSIVASIAVLYAWRVKPDMLTVLGCGIGVMILISPISWSGYVMILLPALLARPWHPVTWCGFLLFVPLEHYAGIAAVLVVLGVFLTYQPLPRFPIASRVSARLQTREAPL